MESKAKKEGIGFVADEIDSLAIFNAVGRRLALGPMPNAAGDLVGRALAEICRGWEEMLDHAEGKERPKPLDGFWLDELRRMNMEHDGIYALVPNLSTGVGECFDVIELNQHSSDYIEDCPYESAIVATGKTLEEAVKSLVEKLEGGAK